MFRRITIAMALAVAALSVPFLPAVANADEPCATVFFDVPFGQGIKELCADRAGGRYQVIAACTDGHEIWTAAGTFADAGTGPSVATCQGVLLFPAHVLTYYVVR